MKMANHLLSQCHPFMPRLLLVSFLCFASLIGETQAQVLTQTITDLGHGFQVKESQQVNVKGRWHSDKRFKFLYFGKRFICQCTQIFISPAGQFAVYQDASSLQISRFKASTQDSRSLSKISTGKLIDLTWSKNERYITLHIAEKPEAPEVIKKIRLGLR